MKKKKKKEPSLKTVNRNLDIAWSRLVKERAGGVCEYCGRNTTLNSHHIYGRRKFNVRWDLDNGVSLCVSHHTYNHKFSAHITPLEFLRWLKKYRGEAFMDNLERKANTIKKWTKHEKIELLNEFKKSL